MSSSVPAQLRFKSPVIFVCDIQDRFRNVIYEFDKMCVLPLNLSLRALNTKPPITTPQTPTSLPPRLLISQHHLPH
ncbi:hypothetical protein G7046_g8443 [Stylonectria norvegica]|nr:hypothetical protein G7046_g8443 [Stylonectria norvegica]